MPDASSSSSDAAPVQNPQQQVPQTNATDIGIDRAKAIAFEDAGVTADEVTLVQEKLDRDGMRQVYEIEFLTADRQYDYEIDATTGAILESKWQLKSLVSLANGSGDIGASAAEGIALADAGVTADQVILLRTNRELIYGLLLYEIEFILSPLEYDYTFDAATGTIIEVTKEQAR